MRSSQKLQKVFSQLDRCGHRHWTSSSGSERFSICLELRFRSWRCDQLGGQRRPDGGCQNPCFMFCLHHPNSSWRISLGLPRAVKGWGGDSSLNNPFMWSIQPQLPSSELHQMADVGWCRPNAGPTKIQLFRLQNNKHAIAHWRCVGVTDISPSMDGGLLLRKPSKLPKDATAPADGAQVQNHDISSVVGGVVIYWIDLKGLICLWMVKYANKKRVGMTTIQTRRYTSWFPLAPHHIPGFFYPQAVYLMETQWKAFKFIFFGTSTHTYIYIYVVIPCIYNIYI